MGGRSVIGQLRRAKRTSRTERLAAANSVLVIAAYFDAMRSAEPPFDLDELAMTTEEQVAVATGGHPQRDLARTLLRSSVPMPQPHQPYEDTLTANYVASTTASARPC